MTDNIALTQMLNSRNCVFSNYNVLLPSVLEGIL